ncbi:thioredoxin domain-containing protein [bacterium AH-315-F18]|nr:thioredoxin domain-containing protein [bacterium AH-315-F18]
MSAAMTVPKLGLFLVRTAIVLSAISLLGDIFNWDPCGGDVCASGMWARYRNVFGFLPVSGVSVVMLFSIQTLWQLHQVDFENYRGYDQVGATLLALTTGGAAFYLYVQVAVIGEFCLLCVGTAATIATALALVVLHGPRLRCFKCAILVSLGFLAINFAHHSGPMPSGLGFDQAMAEAVATPGVKGDPSSLINPSEKTDAALRGRLSRAKTLGKSSAPVTLEVFSDLACPHCARFESEVLPMLIKKFVNSGKLRIVLRSFYASGHDKAKVADVLAHGAALLGPQSTYLSARERLFEVSQSGTGDLKTALSGLMEQQDLARVIKTHGGVIKASINADLRRARVLGINAPPSFAIHTESHKNIFMGMQRPAVFKAAIEHALQQN